MILFAIQSANTYASEAKSAVMWATNGNAPPTSGPLSSRSQPVFKIATISASLNPNNKNANITTKSLNSIFKNGAIGRNLNITH